MTGLRVLKSTNGLALPKEKDDKKIKKSKKWSKGGKIEKKIEIGKTK